MRREQSTASTPGEPVIESIDERIGRSPAKEPGGYFNSHWRPKSSRTWIDIRNSSRESTIGRWFATDTRRIGRYSPALGRWRSNGLVSMNAEPWGTLEFGG